MINDGRLRFLFDGKLVVGRNASVILGPCALVWVAARVDIDIDTDIGSVATELHCCQLRLSVFHNYPYFVKRIL